MTHTSFREHCDQASSELRELAQVIDIIDTNMLGYMNNKGSTTALTSIVRGMNRANQLAQQIKYGHVPFIKEEDKAVGEAIEIAVNELVRRLNGARDDLEVLTKTQRAADTEPKPKYLNVRPIARFNPVS